MQPAVLTLILDNYLLIAVIFSLLMAVMSTWIFKLSFKINDKQPPAFYDVWVSFVGAGIGWLALYSFIASFEKIIAQGVSFADVFLLLVTVLGIIGLLPTFLVKILNDTVNLITRNKS